MRCYLFLVLASLGLAACGDATPAGPQPGCGNGTVEDAETCDQGDANSDTRPDACRLTCVLAACGDRVQDTGETCDQGNNNSDTTPDACRTNCQLAGCGDGTEDTGEECDDGVANSNDLADACRTTCRLAHCGDGTEDTGEECDDGVANSNLTSDACRTTCELPFCGDGVVDTGEECDDAEHNSDTAADACRMSCLLPTCGDNVLDTGETCDPAVTCPTAGACADANACTTDDLVGSDLTCDAACVNTPIVTCADGDNCCPAACSVANDSDCADIDPTSAVVTTSSCLTASTGAQAAVVVTLLHINGSPIAGADVLMNTTAGALSAVSGSGNTYWAILTPPNSSGSATVTVTANGTLLATEPTIDILPAYTGAGGAGGCPVDGNLRVRVVDATGAPLAGAHVMVGMAEVSGLYEDTYGAGPSAASTATTNAQGYVEWRDFGAALDGAQTVTAGATDRQYTTFYALDAADLVLPLEPVVSAAPTGKYHGDALNVSVNAGDPIEFVFVLPHIDVVDLTGFRLEALLADSECYPAGGSVGDVEVPGNIYIPAQCALSIGICLQTLPEHEYTTAPLGFGPNRLVALEGTVPLDAITGGGGLASALLQLSLRQIGAQAITVAASGQTIQNLDTPTNLTSNVACSITNAPTAADAFCLAAGDWESAGAGLTPGAGHLFVMGFKVGDTVGNPTLSITGVTSAAKAGAFAGIDYVGAAVATYLDAGKVGIPPGTDGGASGILNRSGSPWAAGPMVFDNFFPIRTMTRAGRDFSLSSLPGATHPPAHLVRHTLFQEVDETYAACAPGSASRTRSQRLWDIYTHGAADAFALPTLPASWPRANIAGDLQGLVDPAATPEADKVVWTSLTAYEGLNAGFLYDAIELADYRAFVTHVTTNKVDF